MIFHIPDLASLIHYSRLLYRYASKENDTWARSLVKDLTVEAGSGLVIIEPVDISGGYTSLKDKTNITVVSTDICIHLSLSVVSLLLQLQEQATSALQFGNVNPLASCANFKRVWVSPEGCMFFVLLHLSIFFVLDLKFFSSTYFYSFMYLTIPFNNFQELYLVTASPFGGLRLLQIMLY